MKNQSNRQQNGGTVINRVNSNYINNKDRNFEQNNNSRI
jgi:hypothetical protein